jgi:hypothetical protein
MLSVNHSPDTGRSSLVRLGQSCSPVRCLLIELYKIGISCPVNLRALVIAIKNGTVKPFFCKEEIDQLFTDQVLKYYARGRYYHDRPLNDQAGWNDLINNLVSVLHSNQFFLKEGRLSDEELTETHRDIRQMTHRLKIIEDWLYFHPEEQERILAFPQSA